MGMFFCALARAGIPVNARGGRKAAKRKAEEEGEDAGGPQGGTLWPVVLATCLPQVMGQAMGEMMARKVGVCFVLDVCVGGRFGVVGVRRGDAGTRLHHTPIHIYIHNRTPVAAVVVALARGAGRRC